MNRPVLTVVVVLVAVLGGALALNEENTAESLRVEGHFRSPGVLVDKDAVPRRQALAARLASVLRNKTVHIIAISNTNYR